MLRIAELTKTYPSGVQALRRVTLDIPAGLFGLLGPNGAGKTTLMKIAATLLDPDSGTIELGGRDVVKDKRATRRSLGYLPQEFGLYPVLTAEQTLDYFAKLKGVVDDGQRKALVGALLERVNLSAVRNQRVGGFSGGMRQRLGIAQAIIGRPMLLIVDEPTAGLDPEERARFHNLLSEIASDDTVVILSTHIVSDVSSLCRRMAIMRRGEILASGTTQQALAEMAGAVWEAAVPRDAVAALRARFAVISSHQSDGETRVRVYLRGERPGPEFDVVTPMLDDYYFSRISGVQ